MAKAKQVLTLGNPLGFKIGFWVFKVVANVIKRSGLLDTLKEKAEATSNEIDDYAVKLAIYAIDLLAD